MNEKVDPKTSESWKVSPEDEKAFLKSMDEIPAIASKDIRISHDIPVLKPPYGVWLYDSNVWLHENQGRPVHSHDLDHVQQQAANHTLKTKQRTVVATIPAHGGHPTEFYEAPNGATA